MLRRQGDLSRPRAGLSIGAHYDTEAFGRFSEGIARYIGTARFLVIQSFVVVVWIAVNVLFGGLRFDEYPFILLTLALSLQAAYAAPLILLAQNRQDERDRLSGEEDRRVNARTQADTEYLARELASVRLTLSDVVSSEDLRDAVARVTQALEDLRDQLDGERAGSQNADPPMHRVGEPTSGDPQPT